MASTPTRSTPTRILEYSALALLLAHLVWTLPGVRPGPGFNAVLDGVVQGAGYVVVTALAVTWARQRPAPAPGASRTPEDAVAWLLVAGIGLRALGFVLMLTFLGLERPLGYPSAADLAWVLSSVAVITAVVLRLRSLAPRLPLLVALDGVAASLVLVGIITGLLTGPLQTLTAAPGTTGSAVAVNILYPVIDAALLVAVAALVSVGRSRLVAPDLLLIASVVASVVVDVTYVVLLAAGLWRPGTVLASLSLVATGVLALAVRNAPGSHGPRRTRPLGEPATPTVRPGTAIPPLFVAISLVGLSLSSVLDASPLTLVCFGLTGVVAVVRGARTFSLAREVAGVALGEATTDLRQFQALVEASSDLIGMADAEGRLLYVNPAGRRLLAVPPDRDVRTLTVGEVAPGARDASYAMRWPRLLETGSWEGETELVPLDGSERIPVAISTFMMYDSETGKPLALATIQRDIRDLRRQQSALRDVADQRAHLLHRLVRAQEAERSKIAADVHDDSVQALAVVDLRLGALRRRIAKTAPELLETVDDVQEAVSGATDRLRHLLFDLESPAREVGLRSALTTGAEVVFADTDVVWQVTGVDDPGLSDAERITAYRVAMEAMVNVRKHADASRVTVSLVCEPEALVVSVRDDGLGIAPEDERERPGHRGLVSMRDRAAAAGGELDVRPLATGGTEVRLSLPTTDSGWEDPNPGTQDSTPPSASPSISSASRRPSSGLLPG